MTHWGNLWDSFIYLSAIESKYGSWLMAFVIKVTNRLKKRFV